MDLHQGWRKPRETAGQAAVRVGKLNQEDRTPAGKRFMRIAVACDHRGYEAKRRIIPVLKASGHVVEDFGCDGTSAVDYPDYATPAARAVAEGRCDIGI